MGENDKTRELGLKQMLVEYFNENLLCLESWLIASVFTLSLELVLTVNALIIMAGPRLLYLAKILLQC